MKNIPVDFYYTEEHLWLHIDDDDIATVGITHFAQTQLGDVVFVELPELNSEISAGAEISVVESVKTASDIHAPVSGEVIAINDDLKDSPEIINTSPYDKGWILKIRMSDTSELEELLSATEYADHCAA
ncbi:MAG: glycine cleavage system protein GcvH [Pseudohongiellaceae bacterium]|jgi:glycine cleavage system H protein